MGQGVGRGSGGRRGWERKGVGVRFSDGSPHAHPHMLPAYVIGFPYSHIISFKKLQEYTFHERRLFKVVIKWI